MPRGIQPATSAVGRVRCGALQAFTISCQEPGPIGGTPGCRRDVAPALRSASAAGRPYASLSPSKFSPAEWATMNQGGTPQATSDPIIDPALVPTMLSALIGSQPVSRASAYRPPVSQAPPRTPPAPRTSPTFIQRAPCAGECKEQG